MLRIASNSGENTRIGSIPCQWVIQLESTVLSRACISDKLGFGLRKSRFSSGLLIGWLPSYITTLAHWMLASVQVNGVEV